MPVEYTPPPTQIWDNVEGDDIVFIEPADHLLHDPHSHLSQEAVPVMEHVADDIGDEPIS